MAGLLQEMKRRNVVRVGVAYIIVGWVVVQIGQLLFESFGTPDWVIKTVIVLIGLGFPFALIFAWAFELTPDGLKKTREVDVTSSITPKTGQKLNYVIIASLVIALGYFIWERQSYEMDDQSVPVAVAESFEQQAADEVVATETIRRSIAVLPFVNMSSDTEQEWFADGLTEEVLNSLAKTPDLLVASRTSSFVYKGSSEPITTIATQLGVDHVLEGSVRRGGETLRITAQLIRAADGFHLWSETFDRTIDDVISIQEEIAIQIASALETAMDPEALEQMMKAGTSSVAAYDAYLNGVGLWRAAGATTDIYEALKARDEFERSVQLDPEFARAHLYLYWFWTTDLASNQVLFNLTELPREEKIRYRDEAIANAIRFENDPLAKEFYRANEAWGRQDTQRAYRLFSEYRNKRPNDEDAFGSLLLTMRELGRFDEITKLVRGILERDELTVELALQSLQGLRTTEDSALMRELAQQSIAKYGDNNALVLYQSHRQLLWAGDIDGASLILPRVMNANLPDDLFDLAQLRQMCAENRVGDAGKQLENIKQKHPSDLGMWWIGMKTFGDEQGAIELLAEFDESGDFGMLADYLAYAHFDPKPFPNFMKKLAGQGMETRQVIDLPYRCNR